MLFALLLVSLSLIATTFTLWTYFHCAQCVMFVKLGCTLSVCSTRFDSLSLVLYWQWWNEMWKSSCLVLMVWFALIPPVLWHAIRCGNRNNWAQHQCSMQQTPSQTRNHRRKKTLREEEKSKHEENDINCKRNRIGMVQQTYICRRMCQGKASADTPLHLESINRLRTCRTCDCLR